MVVYVVSSGQPYDGGERRGVYEDVEMAIADCEAERRGNRLDWDRPLDEPDRSSWRWFVQQPWDRWRSIQLYGAGPDGHAHWWRIEAVEFTMIGDVSAAPLRFTEAGARIVADLILNPPRANERLRALFRSEG